MFRIRNGVRCRGKSSFDTGPIPCDGGLVSTPEAPVAEGQRKWVNWTCLACDHPFRSRTRRGLYLTCPRCKEVQRGPEGVRQALAELARLRTTQGRKAAPTKQPPGSTRR